MTTPRHRLLHRIFTLLLMGSLFLPLLGPASLRAAEAAPLAPAGSTASVPAQADLREQAAFGAETSPAATPQVKRGAIAGPPEAPWWWQWDTQAERTPEARPAPAAAQQLGSTPEQQKQRQANSVRLFLPILNTPDSGAATLEVEITPDGGEVRSADGRIVLDVPAGAVAETVLVTLRLESSPPTVAAARSTGLFFDLSARTLAGAPVSRFVRPLSLQVRFTARAGQANAAYTLAYYSESEARWLPLPSQSSGDGRLTATTDHFTDFAVLLAEPTQVVCDDPVDPLFQDLYDLLGGADALDCPSAPAYEWDGAWAQRFDNGGAIVYNSAAGAPYYLGPNYLTAYDNAGGPDSFLGLPLRSSTDNEAAPDYYRDYNSNFTTAPIQRFVGGFIGKSGGSWQAARHYPLACAVSVTVIREFISGTPTEDDPDPPDIEKKRISVAAGGIADPLDPDGSSFSRAELGLENITAGTYYTWWMQAEGTGFVYSPDQLFDPDDDLAVSVDLHRAGDNRVGFFPQTWYLDLEDEPVPAGYNTFTLSGCSGVSLPGGGTYTPPADTVKPTVNQPRITQDGFGNISVATTVTDNVGVADVTMHLDGGTAPMAARGGSSYAANAYGLSVGTHRLYITARDFAGNEGRWPEDGSEFIFKIEYSGVYGEVDWVGYSPDPINTLIGNFIYEYRDLTLVQPGPDLEIRRFYNSQSGTSGRFGLGWSTMLDMRVTAVESLLITGAQVRYGDGRTANFPAEGTGFGRAPYGFDTLERDGAGYLLTRTDQIRYRFNAEGRLTRVEDLSGNALELIYAGANLSEVRATDGSVLRATSDTAGRITRLDGPGAISLSYTYDGDGRLLTATDAKGETATYTYDANGMTRLDTPAGRDFLGEQRYDGQGRVTFQRVGENFINAFVYDDANRTATLTDTYGNTITYIYDEKGRLVEQVDALGGSEQIAYNADNKVTSRTDQNGNTTSYQYDGDGNKVLQIDALGNRRGWTYDGEHRVTSETDELGRVTRYEYDGQGRRTAVIDPLGQRTEMRYNSAGQIEEQIASGGRTTRYSYDSAGNLLSETDALGAVTRYEYDAQGRRVKQTDALGGVRSWAYDANGNLVSETDPLGRTTTYGYDEDNNRAAETDAAGNTTRYAYNKLGRLVTITHVDGGTTRFVYDDMGNQIAEIDPLGNTTRSERDELYRVVREIDAAGAVTSHSYDAAGNRLSTTDPRGHVTRYEYDALNRLVKTIDPLGGVTTFTYDAAGNRLSETLPNGATTNYIYDALDRTTQLIDALGGTTITAYDPAGNTIAVTDALGNVTRTDYDILGRAVAVTDALGHTTNTDYDALGRVVGVTDTLGHTTSKSYDAAGQLIRTVDALGGVTQVAYNLVGSPIAVTDALGFTTRTNYEVMRRAVAITDALGGVTRQEYDLAGRQVAIIDANGNRTTTDYDPTGRVVKITDPLGFTVTLEYDLAGNLVAQTDQEGNTTRYEYDALNRKVRETNALGFVTTFAYDSVGNLIATTDALGAVTEYSYDLLGRRTAMKNALGAVTTFAYDALGRLTRTTFANGATNSTEYDALGRKLRSIDGEGFARSVAYDAVGNPVQTTDANGNMVVTSYDALRRKVEVRDAVGVVQRLAYDAVGSPIRETDGNGNSTTFTYDALRRRLTSTDAEGHTTAVVYDAVGNIVKQTDGNGNSTTFTYDARNQRLSLTNALGHSTTFMHDGVGRTTRETDALGVMTVSRYDAVGQLTAVTLNWNASSLPNERTNVTTTYAYDAVGNRVKTTNPNGASVTFTPALLRQLVAETDPLGTTARYVYDSVGNQIERREPNGNVVRTDYDRNNRVVRERYSDGAIVAQRYDGNGNLIEVRDRTGVTTFTYDARDRQVREAGPQGSVATAYDAADNRTSMTYPDGRSVRYDYARNRWLAAVTNPNGNVTRYTRDGVGQVTLQSSGNGTVTVQRYDTANQLLLVETRQGDARGRLLVAVSYVYDAVGQRTDTTYDYRDGQPRTVRERQRYDQLRRLLSKEDSEGVAVRYRYDAASNRLSWSGNDDPRTPKPFDAFEVAYTYDAADQLLRAEERVSGTVTTFSYDANGNRIERAAAREATVYSYEGSNRLAVAQEFQVRGERRNPTEITEMVYDGLGRRVTKTVDTEVGGGGAKTKRYVYAGSDPIGYTQEWNSQHLNLYRTEGGRVLAQDRYTGGANGQQLWLTQDGLGSTVGLAHDNGRSAKNYRYDSYGIPDTREFDSDTHVSFMYTGQEYDESTGLYHFYARDYDPETGTWLTRDPYRGTPDDPQSLHRYGYVKGNPTNLYDVLGYAACGTYGKCKPTVPEGFDLLFQLIKMATGRDLRADIDNVFSKTEGGGEVSLKNLYDIWKGQKTKGLFHRNLVPETLREINAPTGKIRPIAKVDLDWDMAIGLEDTPDAGTTFFACLSGGLRGEFGGSFPTGNPLIRVDVYGALGGELKGCLKFSEYDGIEASSIEANLYGSINGRVYAELDARIAGARVGIRGEVKVSVGFKATFKERNVEPIKVGFELAAFYGYKFWGRDWEDNDIVKVGGSYPLFEW